MSEILSRELVEKTLNFDHPTRVPTQLWLLPWATNHYPQAVEILRRDFSDDIINSPGFFAVDSKRLGNPYEIGEYIDEWGCVFENRQKGVIGEVKKAAIPSLGDLSDLVVPLETLTINSDAINNFCQHTDRFVMAGCCPRPFERMQFLRTSANLYIDIAEDSIEFHELIAKVHNFYLDEMELWAKTNVDALSFMDDWGAQSSLLISPNRWRELFKPLYKDYIDLAHRYGKYVFMHSDGFITDIIPDLIELGLDALNSQLFVMDIESLGEKYAGKITFWGEIDRQHILPSGDLNTVRKAVQRVKDSLWKNGGCIAQCEFGAGAKPENVRAVFETWQEFKF